jgi:hypothetical protein
MSIAKCFFVGPSDGDSKCRLFFGSSSPTPIYQWLPSMSMGPQVIDPAFSRHLDLAFTVNTEKYEKHRALHLMNVSRHLSGSYMCKAESSKQRQSRSQKAVLSNGAAT